MVVGHRDITARKVAERALDQCMRRTAPSRARPDGGAEQRVVDDRLLGPHLRNRFANHAYRDWFGIDPATIPGKHIREVIGEERYRLNLPYIEACTEWRRAAVRARHPVAGWPLGAPCAGPLHSRHRRMARCRGSSSRSWT
jgi:PAS domain-containing protein